MNIEDRTPQQREAIDSTAARLAIIAGPGSGKTDTTAARVASLIDQGVPPIGIVAITYTNEAARNLEERVRRYCVLDGPSWAHSAELGFAGTLHGFGLRMLRTFGAKLGYDRGLAVIDADAADELLVEKARSLKCKASIRELVQIRALGRPRGSSFTTGQLVVLSYLTELHESGLIDFDSILTEFVRLLEIPEARAEIRARFSHFVVDEVQDMNAIDWEIIEGLPIENKFTVGDPDQAIFGFRGGRPDLLTRFARSAGVHTIHLEANFRCGVQICDAANRLISRNRDRIEKGTYSAHLSPAKIEVIAAKNEGEELGLVLFALAEIPAGETVAILTRTNAIATEFRDAIRTGGGAVEEPPASTTPPDWSVARSLIELLANPFNDVLAYFYFAAREERKGSPRAEANRRAQEIRREAAAAGKALNALWLGFPADSSLDDVGRLLDREGLCRETHAIVGEMIKALPAEAGPAELALEVARQDRAAPRAPTAGIAVTTIHAAKGREWDHVFIVGFEDEVFPGKRGEVEEERRLAFVALTRARKSVTITWAATRRAAWGYRPLEKRTPSRFIGEALP